MMFGSSNTNRLDLAVLVDTTAPGHPRDNARLIMNALALSPLIRALRRAGSGLGALGSTPPWPRREAPMALGAQRSTRGGQARGLWLVGRGAPGACGPAGGRGGGPGRGAWGGGGAGGGGGGGGGWGRRRCCSAGVL